MIVRLTIVLLVASTAVASAETKLDSAGRWMARQIGYPAIASGSITLPKVEERMLALYDMNRLPHFNDAAYGVETQNQVNRMRAASIAKFLEKDFDNDGKITKNELEMTYGPQSKLPLHAAGGLEIVPTPQQSAELLAQLIAKDMQSDTNGDGVIDFDEMRAAAETPEIERYFSDFSARRPMNPATIRAFDTSGDEILSRDEFFAAIRKTFTAIDADNNGVLSAAEATPYMDPRLLKRKTPPFGISTSF